MAITKESSYEHGIHNEKACDYLHLNGTFPDWTITTAFYACVHFVTSKIFPFHQPITGHPDTKIESLEAWQNHKNYASNKRHALLNELVSRFTPEIAGDYDWMLRTAWNARYHHYQYDSVIVNSAIGTMKKIKKLCALKGK